MDSLFDTSDESLLRWRMSVEEEENNIVDDEDSTAEPLLKTVVRTSYLYHLRQSLRKNLESSKQKNVCDIEENMINKVIKGCSALLEEKALRGCMIARLYQRVMAQTIKEVKKATADGQLYSPLQEFANRQSKLPSTSFCDKEIQTDDVVWQSLPPNSLQTSDPARVKPDQSSDNLKYSRSANGMTNANEWHVQHIDSTSDSRNHSIQSLTYRNACDENKVHFENSNANGLEIHKKVVESNNFDSSRSAPKNVDVVVKQELDPVSDFTSNSASLKNDSFQLKLRSPNFVECVAYWYSLECELEELPPAKRRKLDEKFTQLFGKDHAIDYYFLSDEQKSITCRKRIAKHVVMELTNHYNQKKIASKQLFKTMAKHITSILLSRSLFPDPTDIKRSVAEFFVDGRVINSEDDFYF